MTNVADNLSVSAAESVMPQVLCLKCYASSVDAVKYAMLRAME